MVLPGECYVVDQDGKHKTRALYPEGERSYPEAGEAHSAADLLRPLALSNARLLKRVEELETALRRLEWVWSDAGPTWCRECGAPRTLGHDESCRLGILLNRKEA